MARKLTAEFIGTFILVFVAVGTAVAGIGAARDDTSQFPIPASLSRRCWDRVRDPGRRAVPRPGIRDTESA